jgi:ribosomal protein S18 acetylase RimI-like enzyme
MMKAMLDWGKAQGCAYAWVATEPDNEQAKGFYAAQRYTSDTIALFARELS